MANGAIRPSGNSYRYELAQGIPKDNGHEALNEFLKPTMGYMIFQENIMQFLTDFANHTGAESDTVRRGLAKKSGTHQYLPKIREGFIEYMTNKYDETVEHAEEILESFLRVIEDASDYGFSINHSQPYSYTGYAGAWLRYHYPLEFLTVALNLQDDDQEKTTRIINYAKKKNVEIKSIEFGRSRAFYSFNREEMNIYKGIASIKFLNTQVAEELYELSKNNYNKNDFVMLLKDIFEKTSANTRQMEILIRLDFFKEFGEKEILLEIYLTMADKKKANTALYPEFADKIVKEKKRKRNKQTKQMEEVYVEKTVKTPLKYDVAHIEKTKEQRIKNLKSYEVAVRKNPPRKIELYEQISFEKENLGYAISTFPTLAKNIALVIGINKKYTPVLNLYRVRDGQEIRVKVNKKLFWKNDRDLLFVGDVIRVLDVEEQYAWKKDGNKWCRDKTRTELYLKKCEIIRESNLRKP